MIDDTNRGKPLEPFLLLAKTAKGAAAAQLIRQVCEAANVFVFGELLQVDSIKELENATEHAKDWNLLQLFAFGTYPDYINAQTDYPELSENHIKKLRLLTIATLASKSKYVSYTLLQESLGIENLRQIEDLIIEAVYADVLRGKLDQREKRLEVDFVIGRDLKTENIDSIIDTLERWCENCERLTESLDTQSVRANSFKEVKLNKQKQVDAEVENVKKAMKLQDIIGSQDDNIDSTIQQQRSVNKLKGLKTTMRPSSSRTR